MSFTKGSLATQRYNRRMIVASLLYVAILFSSVWLISRQPIEVPVRAVLACLTALPIVGIFFALGRYLIEEGDEYLRLLMVRQMLTGTGLALSFCTVWGFLENYEVAPHLPLYAAAIAWFGCFGIAGLVRRLGH